MDGEIEQYLLDKVMEAIKAAESAEQSLLVKLVPLRSQFLELKKLLEKKANPSPSPSPSPDVPKLNREKLYYLNNVLTEWLMLSKKQRSYSPEALRFAINLNSSLKKIKKDLKVGDSSSTGGSGSGSGSGGGPSLPPNPQSSAQKKLEIYRWSCRSVDAAKVHGLDDQVLSMERLLVGRERNDEFRGIGIVGMGGIGKTTLSQVIFNKQQVKNHFLPRIWVCLSKKPNQDGDNRKEIVKRMLICLGVEEEIINSADEKHGLPGLVFSLHLQLKGKRYLIVLDDAWDTDDFCKNLDNCLPHDGKWGEKLAYGLPKGNGGTVIVTSRSEEIAKNMVHEENLRRLQPLPDRESCWLIFKDSVEKDGIEFPSDLEILKEEIVKKCAGLPLAAKMMGQIKHEQLQTVKQQDANHQQQQEST
uniref:NB-ARC domain-containing protein n=1 Tax=Davidia involucrata TaxID=16924 RepID=A0A5B6ZUG6_DAVIN